MPENLSSPPAVVAVVVAFNRSALLADTLRGLLAQDVPPEAIVVVDNGSTDDSLEVTRSLAPDADIVALSRNTGGAGGFTVGIQRAVTAHGADLVWIMDDDTVPTPGALAALLDAHRARPDVSVLASRVVWTDGREHPMNMPRPWRFVSAASREAAERLNTYPIRSASFVSLLLDAQQIRRRGLPISDYFLWNDDFEYSARLIRRRGGLLVRSSDVVHQTKSFGDTRVDPGERFYLEVRNKIWLFRYSRAFNPFEKALFVAATLRRWLVTYVTSGNRRVLRDCAARGLRDGFRDRPRPNSVSLEGLGAVTDEQAAFESGFRVGR